MTSELLEIVFNFFRKPYNYVKKMLYTTSLSMDGLFLSGHFKT